MPIVSEAGRLGNSGSSGFGRRRGRQRSGPAGGSSSVVLGSDSRAAVLQSDEMEESDGEVQSSIRGSLDTMNALQEALPINNRKRVPKFYNGKPISVANAAEPAQDTANPGKPSPKKRKGFLSFSFSWNKSRSKGSSSSSRRDADAAATSSKNNWRETTLPPSPTTSSSQQCNGRRGGDGHARRWMRRRSSTSRGASASPPPPASRRSQRIAVQMQSVCLEDVEESTASISSREKRRRSLR